MPRKAKAPKPVPNTIIRNGTYAANFQYDGIRYRESLHTTDGTEAAVKIASLMDRITAGPVVASAKDVTFEYAVLEWTTGHLDGLEKRRVANGYLGSIGMMIPTFGGLLMSQITKSTITAHIKRRRASGTSNRTIQNDLSALSSLMWYCEQEEWLTDNPARFYNRKSIKGHQLNIRPPRQQDFEYAVGACFAPMRPILHLLRETGMRLNEAVTLEKHQVDFERGTITLLLTKASRPRTLSMVTCAGDATSILQEAANNARGSFLFPNARGVPYTQMSTNYNTCTKGLVAKAQADGLEVNRFRIHDLRHWFAMRWLKAPGGDIYKLSRHLGHSSVLTTESSYIRHFSEDEQMAIKSAAGRASDGDVKGTEVPHEVPQIPTRPAYIRIA